MRSYILVLLATLATTGCVRSTRESQTDTQKQDTISVQGDLSVPDGNGGILLLPLDLRVVRSGTEVAVEASETKTGPDTEAIAGAVMRGVKTLLSSGTGGGMPALGTILDTVVGGTTTAGIRYLALAKRRQMRQVLPQPQTTSQPKE